jgi:hypothetical protein
VKKEYLKQFMESLKTINLSDLVNFNKKIL